MLRIVGSAMQRYHGLWKGGLLVVAGAVFAMLMLHGPVSLSQKLSYFLSVSVLSVLVYLIFYGFLRFIVRNFHRPRSFARQFNILAFMVFSLSSTISLTALLWQPFSDLDTISVIMGCAASLATLESWNAHFIDATE